MRRVHQRLAGAAVLWITLVAGATASAGDFYALGLTGISGGVGQASGANSFVGFDLIGEDTDASPALGGAIGFEFWLGDVISRDVRLPEAVHWKPKIPNFNVRAELEGVGMRDYELKTPGFTTNTPYHTEVDSWSVMINHWLEWPISPALTAAWKRMPSVDPLSIQFGVGLGFGQTKVFTSDSIVRGATTANNFIYQLAAGIGYDVTDRVQIAAGYRRVEMGDANVPLFDTANQLAGLYRLDLASNEIVLTIKTDFYSLAWPYRSTARRMDW